MENQIVIDATNAVLGRLASYAAKQALLGKNIIIVNCQDALITGRRDSIISEYKKKKARGGSSLKGPHFPSSPERILKRTIRGMLSYKQGRGNQALKNIKCYNTLPDQYKESKKILAGKSKLTKTLSIKEVSKLI